MTKLKLSLTSLMIVASLILGTQSSSLRTIINAFASSSGPVPILKDSNGLYVEVNYTASAVDGSDMGKFLLSLVDPKTVLPSSCMSFINFDCTKYNCQGDPYTKEVIYMDPYFGAGIKKMTTQASLSLPGWNLKVNNFLAKDCKDLFDKWVGSGRNGILGLSADEGSISNFQTPQTDGTLFSISLNKDLTGGFLYFSKNSSLVSASASPISLSVVNGVTWRTANGTCSIKFPNGEISTSTAALMFDLHSETISLPETLYSQVLSTFSKYGAQCSTTATSKPTCSFNDLISKLPKITIEIQGKSIPITPQIYLQDTVTATQSQITLLFSKVIPFIQKTVEYNQNFTGSVILGQRFMSNNYIVFQKEAIEIYELKSPSSSSSSSLILIIAIVVVLGVVAGYFVRRHFLRKELVTLSMEMSNKKPLST